MRYLKLFEDLNNSEYYSELTNDEYVDRMWKQRNTGNIFSGIEIPDYCFTEVSKILRKKRYLLRKLDTLMECTVYIEGLGRCCLSIELLEDEWFVVRVNYHDGEFWSNKYFICDQIDGLLKFIDDKTIDNSKLHESIDGYERVGKYDNYDGTNIGAIEDFENIMDFWNTTTVKFSELDIKRFNTIFDPLHYKIVFSQLNDRLLTYLNPRHKIYIKKFDATTAFSSTFFAENFEPNKMNIMVLNFMITMNNQKNTTDVINGKD